MLIIFELANNHSGSLETAISIVDSLKEIVKEYPSFQYAIKLQLRNLATFIHPDYRERFDVPYIQRFVETEMLGNSFDLLCEYIKDAGFKLGVTPFDEESIEKLKGIHLDFVKVASCCANEWNLMNKMTELQVPFIVSTGGLDWNEIDNVHSFLKHKEVSFSLMHCIGEYPTINFNMDTIDKMKRRYPNIFIGYSGHEEHDNFAPSIVAMSKGIDLIERHVCIGEGNKYSMNMLEVRKFLSNLKSISDIRGNDKKKTLGLEKENLRKLKRGVWQDKDKKLFFAIPNFPTQLLSDEFGEYRPSYKVAIDEETGIVSKQESIMDPLDKIRRYVHIVNGMLEEENIKLGKSYSAELSHHYGLDKFEQFGLFSIGLVNREYCKKIIVMLPNQVHPSHKHLHKEETFRVLSGDLLIKIGDKEWKTILPGDSILVERNRLHEFKTLSRGVIFEEISTTHINGDSFYEDKSIYALDPIERKTSVEKL